MENQSAPHRQKEGARLPAESHVADAPMIYPLMDPGTPLKYTLKKEHRRGQGTKLTGSQHAPHQPQEGAMLPVKPHGGGATQIYPLQDPSNEAPQK
jgi:hypothetical protein